MVVHDGLYGINTRTIGVSRDMVASAQDQIQGAFMLAHNDPDLIPIARGRGVKTIYRQDPDERLDQDASEFVRTRAEKGSDFIHGTNEIVASPKLHEVIAKHLRASVEQGQRYVAYNYGTNAGKWQYDGAYDNMVYARDNKQVLGIHIYPDYIKSHTDTLREFLELKHALNIFTICTEFGYLRDAYASATRGIRGMGDEVRWQQQNLDEQGLWKKLLDDWMPFFYEEQIPICGFCFDPWDKPTVEEAKAVGLGFWDRPQTITLMGNMNQVYKFKGEPKPVATVKPKPNTVGIHGQITQFDVGIPFKNVRTAPKLSGADSDIGDLKVNERFTHFPAELTEPENSDWHYIIRDSDGLEGWVLWTGLTFVPTPIVLPPDPPPDTGLPSWTQEEIDDLSKAQLLITKVLKGKSPSSGNTF